MFAGTACLLWKSNAPRPQQEKVSKSTRVEGEPRRHRASHDVQSVVEAVGCRTWDSQPLPQYEGGRARLDGLWSDFR